METKKLYNNRHIDIKKLHNEIENNIKEFHLDIEACDWLFPELQKSILEHLDYHKKAFSFYIYVSSDSEISLLQYLAVYIVFKNMKTSVKDNIVFMVDDYIKDDGLNKIYGKISRFLVLFSERYNMRENILFSRIPSYAKKRVVENAKGGALWPYEYGGYGENGMPLISIDSSVYVLLQKNIEDFINECIVESKTITWNSITNEQIRNTKKNRYAVFREVAIREICRDFTNRFNNIYNKSSTINIDNEIIRVLKNADVLTFLLFGASYFGIYNPGESSKTTKKRQEMLSKENFVVLFEKCATYSMGILQLIENIINYTEGGFLTFRSIKRNKSYLSKVLKEGENEEDFLVISLCDIAQDKDGFQDIIEKFLSNLKNRDSEGSVKSLLEKLTLTEEIKIDDLLFPDLSKNQYIADYLSDPHNVGYHYGLQIFSSSVESSKGDFFVVSGNDKKCNSLQLSQNTSNKTIMDIYRARQNSVYYCGTKFEILLPIKGIVETTESKNSNEIVIPDELSFAAIPNIIPFSINLNLDSIYKDISEHIYNSKKIYNKEALLSIHKKRWTDSIQKSIKEEINHYALIANNDLNYYAPLQINISKQFELNIESNLLLEMLAKSIFLLLSDSNFKYKNIVLYELSGSINIINFVRYYAQYYDRSGYNNGPAKNSQIMLVTDETCDSKCITLSGRYIGKPLYHYTDFTGGKEFNTNDALIEHSLNRIGIRTKSNLYRPKNIETENNPHYFDNVIIKHRGKYTLKWIADLYNAASENFSNQNKIGAKIHDCVTHIHVSGIHLNTFYQMDSIFTNAYWAKMLGNWIAKDTKSDKPIIFVGYSSLIEPVLFNAQQILNIKCEYIIYNEGYHYTAENVANAMFIDNNHTNNVKELLNKEAIVVFVMPISTTLRTFNKMASLFNAQYKLSDKNCVKYYAVFQLFEENSSDTDSKIIINNYFKRENEEVDNFGNNRPETITEGKYLFPKEAFFDKTEKKCKYLFKLEAKWRVAFSDKYGIESCSYCYPQKGGFERMLYSTDDTSLVPTMQLRAFDHNHSSKILRPLDFFEQEELDGGLKYKYADCLLYKHVERDVHFSHYIKTEKLFKKILNNGVFEEKIIEIKKKLKENRKKINIIVAPSHISNQTMPIKVNEYLYENNAHIISVNVKKVYRSNFESQFSNYTALIQELYNRLPIQDKKDFDISKYIGIIYVDDHINTSTTYRRMKSLLNDLFTIYDDNGNRIEKNIEFDAIITLIDRHSVASKRDYIQNTERFFSFFNLSVPAIRTGGDSCFLCKQVADDKKLELASALDSTAYFCSTELETHKVKEISSVNDNVESPLSNRHMRRFECENILWQTILKTENEKYSSKDQEGYEFLSALYDAMFNAINNTLNKFESNERIEYLISFIKVLSKPFLSYRPFVATTSIAFIKSIIEMLLKYRRVKRNSDNMITLSVTSKRFNEEGLVKNKNNNRISIVLKNDSYTSEQLTSLLLVAILGLSNLNSTYILNVDLIKEIISLYQKINVDSKDIFEPLSVKDDSENRERSFADYLRFAVFKIVHHEKFGYDRLQNFENELNKIVGKGDNNLNYYKLIILLYLENADISKEEISKESIEHLRKKILKDENEEKENDVIFEMNIADDFKEKVQKAFSSSIVYIDENELNNDVTIDKTQNIVLTPITKAGYADAYNIGFNLHFLNHNYNAIKSAINASTQQLWGKLELNPRCSEELRTIGIYFNDNMNFSKTDFVFIKFSNEKEMYMQMDKDSEERVLPKMPSLYMRIEFEDDNSIENLKILRSILCSRKRILYKLAGDLSTEDMQRLIAERRFNRSLSITKAYKHATEDAERSTIFEKENDKNVYIAQIRRLLSNRTISGLYQIESTMFESENRKEKTEKYTLKEKTIYYNNDENDMYTQVWLLLKNEFIIKGCKDIIDGHYVYLKFNIDSSFHSSKKVGCVKYSRLKEDYVLLDFVFLLANNAIRHLPINYPVDNNIARIDFKISQKGEYIIFSSPLGHSNITEDYLIRIARALSVPPHVRKYDIESGNKYESDGITLWTIARYYRRLNENKITDKFIFDTSNNIVGFEYFNIEIEKCDDGNCYFNVNLKCIK